VWWRLAVVALVGCGRLSFDPHAFDGASDAVDARSSAAVNAPFAAGQPVPELATAGVDEDDPCLTDDMLEMYFDTQSGLARVTRTALEQPWSSPVMVTELNTGNVNNAKISGDGLTIYFNSTRVPSMAGDVWFATRPDRASAFSTPELVLGIQTANDEFEPMVNAEGTVIYFGRTNVTPSLWRAARASTAVPFGNEQPLTALDFPGYDGSPWVSQDELVVYFHSDRVSSAERAIFRATRASTTDAFSTPVRLIELDVPGKEEDPWLSPDGHTLFYAVNSGGQYDIYMATR
jgi:hypothetical protein